MLLLLISKWFLRVTKELSLAKNHMFSAGVKVSVTDEKNKNKKTKKKTTTTTTTTKNNLSSQVSYQVQSSVIIIMIFSSAKWRAQTQEEILILLKVLNEF